MLFSLENGNYRVLLTKSPGNEIFTRAKYQHNETVEDNHSNAIIEIELRVKNKGFRDLVTEDDRLNFIIDLNPRFGYPSEKVPTD